MDAIEKTVIRCHPISAVRLPSTECALAGVGSAHHQG
jgi:hypothetical protein